MAGVLANGLYLNTESGLTPMIDRLTGMLDKDRQQRDQLAGIAPALAATGVSLPQQPQGMLGGVLSALGIGASQQQLPSPQAPQAAAPATAAAPQTSAYRGPAPGFDNAVTRTLGFEGGMNPRDTNGTPSNFGINQQANPGVDVASLTPDAAKSIYKSQYWDAIGADSMPPALSRAAFDTAVIAGPGKAKELLAASGGDPMKLMDLREQFQNGLVQSDPQKYGPYAKAWASRNNGLRLDIAALNAGGGGMPAGASAYAPQGATPGTSDAGADVAAAGLAARSAAGYGTGAQTAAATGAAPMPIASASPSVAPTMQTGRAPGAAPAAAAATASALPGGIPKEAIGAMVANPASRQLGLQLWEQSLTGKNYGFQVTPAGDVIRTDQRSGTADLVFRAPVKHEVKDFNGQLVDYDPQSSSTRVVTPAGMPQGYRPATAQERAAYGVQPGAPLFFGPDSKPATLNSGTNVTVNNATNPILSGLGKQFVDGRAEADSAAKSLPMIQTAKTQLQNGIIAGAGANQVLALQKLGVALGLPGTDASKIVNTETFSASVKPLVMQLVKNLGSGNGITDADVRFVNEAVGGEKTLEPASLARILDITERAARTKVTDYNSLADEMLKTPGGEAYKLIAPMMHVSMPPAPAAASTGGSKTIGGKTYTRGPDGRWYTGP